MFLKRQTCNWHIIEKYIKVSNFVGFFEILSIKPVLLVSVAIRHLVICPT